MTAPVVTVSTGSVATESVSAAGAAGPVRRSRRTKGRRGHRWVGALLVVGIWTVGTYSGFISPKTLATPGEVWTAGVDLWSTGQLQGHLTASLQRVLWGLAFGIGIGTACALVAGLSRVGESLVDAPVQMLRAMPIIALQPLFILWFGIGEQMKVVFIAFAVAFPVYLNTFGGIRSVEDRYVELARTVRLSRTQLVRKVVLPGALPGFLVGVRYSLAVSWLVLILSEGVNATSGLGFMVNRAGMSGRTDQIVLGLVIYAALGLLSDLIVRIAEARLLDWRRTLGSAR